MVELGVVFQKELEAWLILGTLQALPTTNFTIRNRISSQTCLRLGQLHWQSVPSFLCCYQSPLKMIRNALRQSARTVGAVSVPSRLALVSYKGSLTIMLASRQDAISPLKVAVSSPQAIQLFFLLNGRHWLQKTNCLTLHRTDAQLQQRSMQRQDKPENMLQRQKPHRQRSLRF